MSGFYSTAAWRVIRARQLHHHPLCQGCPEEDMVIATDVDHIIPITSGGSERHSSNLQSLCADCHNAKTNTEREGLTWTPPRLRGCDVDGAPRVPWSLLD